MGAIVKDSHRRKLEILNGCIDSIMLPIAEALLAQVSHKPDAADTEASSKWVELNSLIDEVGIRLCDLSTKLDAAVKDMSVPISSGKAN